MAAATWAPGEGRITDNPGAGHCRPGRESDLVVGTFGRGLYVLDDYSALRDMTPQSLTGETRLSAFAMRICSRSPAWRRRIRRPWRDGRKLDGTESAVWRGLHLQRRRATPGCGETGPDHHGRHRPADSPAQCRSVGRASSSNLELAGRSRHQRSYRTCCGHDRSSASSGRPRQHRPTGRARTLPRHARHLVGDTVTALGDPQTFSVVQVVQDSRLGIGTRDSGLGTRDSGSGIRDTGVGTPACRAGARDYHANRGGARPRRSSGCTTGARQVASAFRRKTCPRRKLRQSGNRPRDRRCEDPLRPGRLQSVQSPGPAAIAAGSPAWLRSDLAV